MQKFNELPSWFERSMELSEKDSDFVIAHSGVMIHEGHFFFTGAVEAFLTSMKIPRHVELALDMATFDARVRLSFENDAEDGKNESGQWRVIYTMLEPEAFAHLWNADLTSIHGLATDQVSLYLNATELGYPVLIGGDIQGDLIFRNGEFYGVPTDEALMQEAA